MLEDLLSKIEAEHPVRGNTGNTGENSRVTATGRAVPEGNTGNTGNTAKGKNRDVFRTSGDFAAPADDDLLTHPQQYEIVEFTDWRLPSGRRVAFKLAILKEKYDGFELLRLLEIQGQQRMTISNEEG